VRDWKRWPLAAEKTLDQPGDLAVLPDGRLVVAERERLALLRPTGQELKLQRRWSRWGEGEKDRFGNELSISGVSGNVLAISDTERNRVLLADLGRFEICDQFGQTDAAGQGLDQLDQPRSISAIADRLVVADRGNQRILRIHIER
jgi:glucose/arabinose dehydrogenase